MELTIHYRVNYTTDPIIVRMKIFRTARLTVPLYVGLCETRFRWKTSPLCGKNIFIKAGKIVSGHVYVYNPIRPSTTHRISNKAKMSPSDHHASPIPCTKNGPRHTAKNSVILSVHFFKKIIKNSWITGC